VIDRLRLHGIEEELKLLFDPGTLSPDARPRQAAMATQASLKAQLAKSPETHSEADRSGAMRHLWTTCQSSTII
jgi:hypothetical protein